MTELTLQELKQRRAKFTDLMTKHYPDWKTALITSTVNQYYFTRTMQDAIIVIKRDGGFIYAVRRSLERALAETLLPHDEVKGISSYRDLADIVGGNLGRTYLEGETVSLVTHQRLLKYFNMESTGYLDSVIKTIRSVKSPYEKAALRESGSAHQKLLEEVVPSLLYEGITEHCLLGEISREMYRLGYQGVSRFHQSDVDMAIGQIGFGDNILTPTFFDGPGGAKGNGHWAPFSADASRKLKKGDAVFVDCSFGIRGYHSDKTSVYYFGSEIPNDFLDAHKVCMDIQNKLAELLKPGEIPSKIYNTVMESVPPRYRDNFMGVNRSHLVKFLGHGTGLNVDEFPVIAKGFDEPLEENMVLALEPKISVEGIGMAGMEDTYIVTPSGGECITGGGKEIIRVVC